jgi:hypothetical protein
MNDLFTNFRLISVLKTKTEEIVNSSFLFQKWAMGAEDNGTRLAVF